LNHAWRSFTKAGEAKILSINVNENSNQLEGDAQFSVKICRKIPMVGSWILTQGTVFLCWIPFRAATFQDTLFIFHQWGKVLIHLGNFLEKPFCLSVAVISFPWLLVLLPLLFDTAVSGSQRLRNCWSLHSNFALYGVIIMALFVGLLFMHSGTVNFIYFQF